MAVKKSGFMQRYIRQPGVAEVLTAAMLALVIGFVVTSSGTHFWDDPVRYRHSMNLMRTYHLLPGYVSFQNYYAPLWELFLGLQTEFIFYVIRSPYWVRHAWNVCFFLTTLYAVYALLVNIGYKTATAGLAAALLFSMIRWGGHSIFNPKDMPAAAAFLFATLALWFYLDRIMMKGDRRMRMLIGAGVVSVVPYLIRIPLLLHAVILGAVLLSWALLGKNAGSWRERLRIVSVPLISALLLIYAASPRLWISFSDAVFFAQKFANIPWESQITIFGSTVLSSDLPWWYVWPWFLVNTHPVAVIATLVGIALLFLKQKSAPSIEFRAVFGRFTLRFELWVAGMLLASWLAIIVASPNLYDEDRHILFLYPLITLLGALGLSNLRVRYQQWLAMLCVIISLATYARWGIYSYAYASPLATWLGYRQNDGDYQALCLNRGLAVLPKYLEPETAVFVYPIQVANMQDLHIRYSRWPGTPEFPHYVLLQDRPRLPYAALVAEHGLRHSLANPPPAEVAEGTVLWTDHLPTGEITCSLTRYE